MTRTLGSCAALIALAACTTITKPPTPESARIVVPMAPVSRSAVLAAFTAEGLTIANSTGDVITSTSLELGSSDVFATYRATLTDSVVILSGTIRNRGGATMASMIAGTPVEAEEDPLHSAMTGEPLAGAWQRIVRISNRLRGVP